MGTYQTVRRLEASSGEETRMLSRPEDSVELGKEASPGGGPSLGRVTSGIKGNLLRSSEGKFTISAFLKKLRL